MRLIPSIGINQGDAKGGANRPVRRLLAAFGVLTLTASLVGTTLIGPAPNASAAAPSANALDLHKTPAPDFNVNLSKVMAKMPTPAQLRALDDLKANLGDQQLTARWDKKSGSVDTIFDFASAPSPLDPEAAARSFIETNAALFGISDIGTLRLKSNHEALGGNLLYFEQTYNGIPVAGSGIGVVMDGERRVKMVSGPYQRDLQLDTTPSLDGATAIARAQADLARFQVTWVPGVAEKLTPALDLLASQLGPMATPRPHLQIFPTADGPRLVWKFYVFSRNPFGFFKYYVDAASGDVLLREDTIRYQTESVLPMTADVFPTYPCITDELKNEGIISVTGGVPCGQIRIGLRNFDPTNVVTGINGTLTGKHAHIESALPIRAPFAQAARGTWHFRNNDPANLEQRTYEREHYGPNAEPAEHQDGIAQFFYINSLIEYIDYLHRAGDAKHSRVGQGHFPDTYPNQSSPLIGNVHIPNVLNPPTNPNDPAFLPKLLGLDNAFSVSASSREVLGEDIAGQNVVVNPTSYGHGYLLNNLAIDFGVPYHEGMHSISSPIAGLENDAFGTGEGSALNEAQADLWAYTAAENPVLGNYPLNGFVYRDAVRNAGNNPDLRQWIRHADSGLLYSQLGTYQGGSFEEHRDGEIWAAAGWDLRELMVMSEPGGSFVRPDVITGKPTVSISRGKENWERILLGAIYVLSSFNPDTMVRGRDAMIIADQSLYPSDPTDPDAPGVHRALIEQVFAARELGVNAVAPNSEGRQTISTRVSEFADAQEKPAAPQNVSVALASPTSNRVSWSPVSGAFAYEVLRREIGKENKRQIAPVIGRPYMDGDAETDGFMHIAYVAGAESAYTDNGLIEEVFVPRGVNTPVRYEYVVRALRLNPNKQVGVSANSAVAGVPTAAVDVTSRVEAINTNITFGAGKVEIDQAIRNLGGAGSGDGTLYQPIDFRIVSISSPSVTVANADNAGTGQAGKPASFYYRETLPAGRTSKTRKLVFNNPQTQLFTFDAVVTARVQVDPAQATRYEAEPTFDENFTTTTFSETFTGIVPAMDAGLQLVGGVTYVDVPFTSQAGALAVTGLLTSPTTGVDLDFELRDSAGRVLSTSGTASSNERVSAAIQPNTRYVYRVVGWAGAAQDFRIVSTQTLRVPKTTSSTATSGTSTGTTSLVNNLVRFTVNPLTRTVTAQVLR
jgi:hypothetical protein